MYSPVFFIFCFPCGLFIFFTCVCFGSSGTFFDHSPGVSMYFSSSSFQVMEFNDAQVRLGKGQCNDFRTGSFLANEMFS